MATYTVPLAHQYTDQAGHKLFQFAMFNGVGHARLLYRNYYREISVNCAPELKRLARHIQHEVGLILPKALSKMRKGEILNLIEPVILFEKEMKPQPVKHLSIITLNLSFRHEVPEKELRESEEDYAEHLRLYHEALAHFQTVTIEAHVKKNDPMEFVEGLLDIMSVDIISAEWLDGFRIALTVETAMSEQELREDIMSTSLEDGYYESGDDNGWTIKTLTGSWEVGLVDYRKNPIHIEKILM
jgi:hypothetical protein